MDARLAEPRFLFGDAPVETDWRLFTTLVRFDAVYNIHFKCSLRRVVDYEHLWPYARDLYQRPGVAETVRFDDIRRHYYMTHDSVNPSRIVAVAPGRGLGRAARPRVIAWAGTTRRSARCGPARTAAARSRRNRPTPAARVALDEHFAGRPARVRAIFDRVVAIRRAAGP